ncbi:hypothetical protein BSKO_05843 [Bryopsis sp. KO-2023]|nr:hypothetical protein BSKO_05843 [Bryopsis sp. KO-2023]
MPSRAGYGPFVLFGGAVVIMMIGGILVSPQRLNGMREVTLNTENKRASDPSIDVKHDGPALAEPQQTVATAGEERDNPEDSAGDVATANDTTDPPKDEESLTECKRILNGTEHAGMARYCECYSKEGKIDADFREVPARVGAVDFSMHVYRRADIVSNEIAARKTWELPTSNMFLAAMENEYKALLEKNSTAQKSDITFLDIGANIGWYSILMAAYGYRVIAIEPMTKNLHALRASMCVNDLQHLMETHHTGLAEEKRECAIVSHGTNTGDGIVVCDDSWKKLGYVTRELVHINRLDDLIPENEPIKLAKIDVEGYEDHVLGGGRRTLLFSGISKIMSEFSVEMMGNAESDPLHYLKMWGDGGYIIRKNRFDTGEILKPSEFEKTVDLWKKAIVNIFIEKQDGQIS